MNRRDFIKGTVIVPASLIPHIAESKPKSEKEPEIKEDVLESLIDSVVINNFKNFGN